MSKNFVFVCSFIYKHKLYCPNGVTEVSTQNNQAKYFLSKITKQNQRCFSTRQKITYKILSVLSKTEYLNQTSYLLLIRSLVFKNQVFHKQTINKFLIGRADFFHVHEIE